MRLGSWGFTLVEVMVSLFILAVSILSFMVLYGIALRYTGYSRVNEEAVAIARSELERVRAEDFDAISSASYSVTTPSGEDCSVSRTVESISSTIKRVDVQVSCQTGSFIVSTVVSSR